MKKIMMVLAAVAMAASVQASAFSWKTATTGPFYLAGTTDNSKLASATAYLFTGDALKATIVDAFAAGTLDLSKLDSIKTATVSNGAIAATPFEYGADGQSNVYWMALVAEVDGQEMLYIGGDKSASGVQGKTTTLQLYATNSKLAALDAKDGYSAAGWYTAVPEPTSGLLLLLGMAGLALKRKQA